jgi:hypothetical protein
VGDRHIASTISSSKTSTTVTGSRSKVKISAPIKAALAVGLNVETAPVIAPRLATSVFGGRIAPKRATIW